MMIEISLEQYNDMAERLTELEWKLGEALQVVRCKDCRHRYEEGDCTHYYWCRLHDRPIDNDNFCAWGERKGGEDDNA